MGGGVGPIPKCLLHFGVAGETHQKLEERRYPSREMFGIPYFTILLSPAVKIDRLPETPV